MKNKITNKKCKKPVKIKIMKADKSAKYQNIFSYVLKYKK